MGLKNVNKPTSVFWGKVSLCCSSVSAFIAGYGVISDIKPFIIAGGVLGVLGTIIPILASDGK